MLRLGLVGFQRFQDAYWKGWLRDNRVPAMVERAWLGLKTKVWQDEMIAVCVGTAFSLCRQKYLSRLHDSMRTSRSELLLNWMELQKMRAA